LEDWIKKDQRLYASFFAAVFTICYFPILAKMAIGWWEVAAYSHGILIIPISLYLIWQDRKRLHHLPIRSSLLAGSLAVIFAGTILMVGRAGLFSTLEYFSLIVMIPAVVLLFLGTAYLKALALPLCYLIFMLPFFDFIGDGVYGPLQILSAQIGTTVLHLFGYAAYLDGLYIQLPKVTLEVAQECAGIRYLISILAIGIPLSSLSLTRWSNRVLLVSSAIVIAILFNGLRVTLVGMMVYGGDTTYSHGPFHVFQGMFVAWVGFIVLFVGAWRLSKRENNDYQKTQNLDEPKGETAVVERGAISKNSWMTAILVLIVVLALTRFYRPNPVAANEAIFSSLQKVGALDGKALEVNSYPFRMAGADREMMVSYPDTTGEIVLYIGYFSTQGYGKKMVGSASSALYKNSVEISVANIQVNKTIIRDGQTNRLFLFWMDHDGRSIANRYDAKLGDLWRLLTQRENNGAMIMVSGDVDRVGESALLEKETRFVQALIPILSGRYYRTQKQ
jgi:EpsI family protein